MRRSPKKTIVTIVAAVALAAGIGGAYAYWSADGTGSGTAATGTSSSITVNQTSTITNLHPGDGPQTLSGNFDNANDSPVFVESVGVTVVDTDQTGCDASDYTIGGSAVVHAEIPVGPGQGSWSGLTIQFNNKPGVNQDACKLATVNLAYASN
ncbi:MAG: hypothetical protein QOI06_2348 [Nocardioidaceae bacterium]|jgi:hypothetical protein|nr:hypothetical protein [Nocardioidaceae bacterium]